MPLIRSVVGVALSADRLRPLALAMLTARASDLPNTMLLISFCIASVRSGSGRARGSGPLSLSLVRVGTFSIGNETDSPRRSSGLLAFREGVLRALAGRLGRKGGGEAGGDISARALCIAADMRGPW